MITFQKSSLVITLTVLCCITTPSPLKAMSADTQNRFSAIYSKNKICTDIVNILNDPANTYFSLNNYPKGKSQNTDFIIPNSYKTKYSRPEWKNLTSQDIDAQDIPENYKSLAKDYQKYHDDVFLQKTETPFFFDSPDVTGRANPFYRIKISSENAPVKCVANNSFWHFHRLEDTPFSVGCNFVINIDGFGYFTALDVQENQTTMLFARSYSDFEKDETATYLTLRFNKICEIKENSNSVRK